MLYSLVTLTAKMGSFPALSAALADFVPKAPLNGTLLGAFFCEIGDINRTRLLYATDEPAGIADDCTKMLGGAMPGNMSDVLESVEVRSYVPFPGIPAIEPGKYGPIYEFRDYGLKPGCVQGAIDAWMKQLPVREKLSKNLMAMWAIDGDKLPRYIHIWPYSDLNHRTNTRAEAIKTGAWPPPGLTPNIASQSTSIWLPTPYSPLQ